MTYIELLKKVDRIFPPTTDFDYRDITFEELWRKVYNLLEKMDLLKKFNDRELVELRDFISFEQKGNYRRKNIIKANRDSDYDYGFDQNNYVVKQSVLRMKEQVLFRICEKARFRYDLITDEFDIFNSNIGSVKEIESIINVADIESYITKLLTISKEDNDYYKFEPSLFVKDILLNYGYNPNSEELHGFISEINKRIESILFSNSNYIDDKTDQRVAESININHKTIKELAELIASMMRKNLQNRQKNEYTITPRGSEKVKNQQREKEIEDLFKQYETQQKLLDRNRKIIEELRRLEDKKIELQKELEENTARMAYRK